MIGNAITGHLFQLHQPTLDNTIEHNFYKLENHVYSFQCVSEFLNITAKPSFYTEDICVQDQKKNVRLEIRFSVFIPRYMTQFISNHQVLKVS